MYVNDNILIYVIYHHTSQIDLHSLKVTQILLLLYGAANSYYSHFEIRLAALQIGLINIESVKDFIFKNH